MNAIELKRVCKQYHKGEFFFAKSDLFWAVTNISFSIKQGETVSLIGPNGAGKTTIVKLISEITYPTEGSILIKGKVVPLISMRACLNPLLSVQENISLLTSVFELKKLERKKIFNAIVDFSGLEDFLSTPIKKLSAGMWARLSFSIAAHVPSDILLIDEVLARGDHEFQEKCFQKIIQFKREGKTIIFISQGEK